jgi:DNA-binding transcriptional MerR regulator
VYNSANFKFLKGLQLSDNQYTLDDLVGLTGFSKRQIRYYITEKLVPGAGDQRGPNAVYGEETLQRLEMIKILKARPMGPTGRTMTLAEIRHSLDNQEKSKSSALNYLASMGDQENEEIYLRASECILPMKSILCDKQVMSNPVEDPLPPPPLAEILQSLQSLLTELGSDTRFDNQVVEGNSWRRITSPDVEIQVRTPDNLKARVRLNRMAEQLGRLLEREE